MLPVPRHTVCRDGTRPCLPGRGSAQVAAPSHAPRALGSAPHLSVAVSSPALRPSPLAPFSQVQSSPVESSRVESSPVESSPAQSSRALPRRPVRTLGCSRHSATLLVAEALHTTATSHRPSPLPPPWPLSDDTASARTSSLVLESLAHDGINEKGCMCACMRIHTYLGIYTCIRLLESLAHDGIDERVRVKAAGAGLRLEHGEQLRREPD